MSLADRAKPFAIPDKGHKALCPLSAEARLVIWEGEDEEETVRHSCDTSRKCTVKLSSDSITEMLDSNAYHS